METGKRESLIPATTVMGKVGRGILGATGVEKRGADE